MERLSTVLIGLGVTLAIVSVMLGVVELATIRTIRPPKEKTFSYMRLATTQYRTVFIPAVGALISGLFVSLSASFFYGSLTGRAEPWYPEAGSSVFIVGAVILAITLLSVLKDVGEPAELARDPFTIRAAADEFSANPRRAALDPDVLTRQLDQWAGCISARSMNLSSKTKSPRLDSSLTRAAETHGFWPSIPQSLRVYYAACLRFPFRIAWPVLGYALYVIGIVQFAVADAALDFTTSWRPWAAVAIFLVIGMAATLFYGAARGNRARLWHRINRDALDHAREAISAAKSAHRSVEAEDALLRRVLKRADRVLQEGQLAPEPAARTFFRLGRLRVSIVEGARRGESGIGT